MLQNSSLKRHSVPVYQWREGMFSTHSDPTIVLRIQTAAGKNTMRVLKTYTQMVHHVHHGQSRKRQKFS